MRLKFWRKQTLQTQPTYASMQALAADWRAILPLACAYPTPGEMPGMQASLIADLYPVKPEDVHARLLAALRRGGADIHVRIDVLNSLYNMMPLEILFGYLQAYRPGENWRLAPLRAQLEGLPADSHTLTTVAQILHTLSLLVATTVSTDGLLPLESSPVSYHRGRRVVQRIEEVDREARFVRDLTPYTTTMRLLAGFVATAEAGWHVGISR